MVLGALAGTEMALRDVGIMVGSGTGVAAAADYYRATAAPLARTPSAPNVAAAATSATASAAAASTR
jgi:hypothetical protein